MSREILFRGRAKTGLHAGKFIYGFYVKDFWRPRKGYGILPIDEEQGGYIEVDPETVGQYTGLRDCKRTKEYPEGQMIFEGDIVRGTFYGFPMPLENYVFVIGWQEDVAGYKANYFENVEVIGNIHDNPELLN